jgi:hypothetical protein
MEVTVTFKYPGCRFHTPSHRVISPWVQSFYTPS